MKIRIVLSVLAASAILALLLSSYGAGVYRLKETVTLTKPPAGQPAYVYVPIEVPAGAESISLKAEYDKKNGKNRLEFGLFDPRFSGKNEDKTGFRGWSGSVRDAFFVAKDDATFGYQKGEIKPGKWYLIVGLAALEKESIDLNLSVEFNAVPAELAARHREEIGKEFKPETKKPSQRQGWFRGDLHTHTFHSDGRWSIEALLDSAAANNLDFISVNDHNTFSHHFEIDGLANRYPKLLILKGEEVTTYGGHLNVWGLKTGDWVDFRVIPNTPASGRKIADEAHGLGALITANHPTMDCGGCGWTYGDWGQMDSVEIWNAEWDPQDEEVLKMWDGLLQKGRRITAIGSSDTHQPESEPSAYPINRPPGSPTVWVKADSLTQKDLFDGIKAGRVYVTEDPSKMLEITVFKGSGPNDRVIPDAQGNVSLSLSLDGFQKGSEVRIISNTLDNSSQISKHKVEEPAFSFSAIVRGNGPGYIRVEVRNPDGAMAAFTNPIWVGR